MRYAKIRQKTIGMCVMGCIAVCVIGCGPSREVRILQEQNQHLTERVTELQEQLEQAGMDYYAATAGGQTPARTGPANNIYTIVQGDTLWSIAKKRLGSGTRYKDILAINPQLAENKPLTVGTKIKLPQK